jgi:two-component system NtrC family sensor kinase
MEHGAASPDEMMFYSTRSKLIVSFISVSLLVGMVSLIVGGQMLYNSILSETSHRVRQDLNVARVIYDDRVSAIRLSLETIGLSGDVRSALGAGDTLSLMTLLNQVAERGNLDFAGVVSSDGGVLCRMGAYAPAGGVLPGRNLMAELALTRKKAVAGTVVLNQAMLRQEEPELARRALIQSRTEEQDEKGTQAEAGAGLVIAAAVPVTVDGRHLGVIYGGILLNRDQSIVDKIGGTVFKNEVYKGHKMGNATIFFKDLRVSTNVMGEDGTRAIGTHASNDVTQRVLINGKRWTDRAFVVNDWYITAYEPITDIFNSRVGMLYVGVLEAKYADVRQRALWVFSGITLAGVALSIGLGWLLASRILGPVNQLIRASVEISKGNLLPEIGPISKSDIGLLQKKFEKMARALREREQRRHEEHETRLLQSEKQASVGKLAAGVAHEINNPLTAVLTFTHLILRRKSLPEDVREDLETVTLQTERVRNIVKGLLNFSRQTRLDPEPINLNRLMGDCLSLMENNALIRGVSLNFERKESLPMVTLDRNHFQSVVVNMIINALDATKPGGQIHIHFRSATFMGRVGMEIVIRDTGSGIEPEHLDKLFDPFFTTKEVGKGTGLGLAVSAGIVERHGGSISVQSKVGEGSTFAIWLPVEPEKSRIGCEHQKGSR